MNNLQQLIKNQTFLIITFLMLIINTNIHSKTYKWSNISQQQYINNLIDCQLQLQEYKWSKNLWPKENKTTKPLFKEVIDINTTRNTVIKYLQMQTILQEKFNIAINEKTLQDDLNRMVLNTQNAKSLLEQFKMFNNNPETIVECISRPYLIQNKINNSFKWPRN